METNSDNSYKYTYKQDLLGDVPLTICCIFLYYFEIQ